VLVDRDNQSVRVALGSVGPTVVRAIEAETWSRNAIDWNAGRIVGDVGEFAALAQGAANAIDDHRSSRAYRHHAVGVCARRALERVFR